MQLKINALLLLGLAAAGTASLSAQDVHFNVDGRTVNVHGFVSQGFAYSDQNNYLTMKTSDGSPAFTDGGLNVSTQITDKFRVGAQVYDRNVGKIGQWHPSLDWAFGDYKFKDWFGVRAGKVKTALGLYNDTQDMEFLHTWALLPQAVYPLDLRSASIAHTGADVYGEIGLHKLGSLDYTAYAGTQQNDKYGGYSLSLQGTGIDLNTDAMKTWGSDLRWTTKVDGLMIGTSYFGQTTHGTGIDQSLFNLPFTTQSTSVWTTAAYVDYVRGKIHFSGEFRNNTTLGNFAVAGTNSPYDAGNKGFFATVAYRINKRLELGTYSSRYYSNTAVAGDPNSDHIFDQTVTARIDLMKMWTLKVEEHFINGYGYPGYPWGFYAAENPQGFKPSTDLFVIRTGFNF